MMRLILSVVVATLTIAANGAIAQTSSGTAFAVAPEVLVTNQHVVAGCSSIEVVSAGGRRKGSVVVADADVDLAVLRVRGLKGQTARLRRSRVVQLGESVSVFGFPLAGSLSSGGNFTSGLVSALRGLNDAAGELQITAPVQPGNSGGPLMDASGLVIGVVEAKLDALRAARATGDIPQNVNFAISLEVLAEFLTKNDVQFRDSSRAEPLETARVAKLAQSFTYRVECRGRSRQARASPGTEVKPPAVRPPEKSSGAGTFAISATDRRSAGAQVDDEGTELRIVHRIGERYGEAAHVDVTSFNYVVLLTGEVPDAGARTEVEKIARAFPGVRSVANETQVAEVSSFGARTNDSYLTSKVKARFVNEGNFNAHHVEVLTEAYVVYLMGIVTEAEGAEAVQIARTTGGVVKVVKIFEYCRPNVPPCN